MRFKTGLIVALAFASMAFASEDYQNDWLYQKSIVINTGVDGANTSALVTNFPVLVRLNAAQSDVFLQAEAGGNDIRFSKADGATPLHFQIENWNAANREAEIWVLVDSVQPNNDAQYVRMFWGNSSAADSSNPQVVFDTSNGYQAVWHMNDSSGNESDATPNGLTAIAVNSPGSTASGAIGSARTLNGSSQYFYPDSSAIGPLNFHMTNSYTISAWVNPTVINTATDSGNAILDKGNNQYILQSYSNGAIKRWGVTTRGNNTFLQDTTTGTITANGAVGNWHHLVGVYRGADSGNAIAESLYYDGNLVNTLSSTYSNTNGRGESLSVFIGTLGAGSAPNGSNFSRYWNGALDEIEVSNQARSASWAKLSYATQAPGTPCLQYGPTLNIYDSFYGPMVGQAYQFPGGFGMVITDGGWTTYDSDGEVSSSGAAIVSVDTNDNVLELFPNEMSINDSIGDTTILTPKGVITEQLNANTINDDTLNITEGDGEVSLDQSGMTVVDAGTDEESIITPSVIENQIEGGGTTTIQGGDVNTDSVTAIGSVTTTAINASTINDDTLNITAGDGETYIDQTGVTVYSTGDEYSMLTPNELNIESDDDGITDIVGGMIYTDSIHTNNWISTSILNASTINDDTLNITAGDGETYIDQTGVTVYSTGDEYSMLTPNELNIESDDDGITDIVGGMIYTDSIHTNNWISTSILNASTINDDTLNITAGDGETYIDQTGVTVYSTGDEYSMLTPNELNIESDEDGVTDIVGGTIYTDSVYTTSLQATGNIKADSITAMAVVTTPEWDVPDYVFEKGYQPQSLKDLETYVQENKHLPDVPSATEMKHGVNVGEMDLRLLKNVEELTLHVIDLNKELESQNQELEKQKTQNASLEAAVQSITNQREGK